MRVRSHTQNCRKYLFCFTEQRRTRGTRSVPGNACIRRRWRIQRADLGAAVEKTEGKRQPEDFFGHRKRGCEATSSPSAPATGKALKPLGLRAFSLCFRAPQEGIGAATSNPSAPAKTKRPSREAETFYFPLSLKAETTPGNKRVNGYKPIG